MAGTATALGGDEKLIVFGMVVLWLVIMWLILGGNVPLLVS